VPKENFLVEFPAVFKSVFFHLDDSYKTKLKNISAECVFPAISLFQKSNLLKKPPEKSPADKKNPRRF